MQQLYFILSKVFPILFFFSFQIGMVFGQGNFQEVSEILNIDHAYCFSSGGGGVSFYDFNHDGWDDLTFATCEGEAIHFYKNNAGIFEKITIASIQNVKEAKHILWVDYDNDGDADLFVTSFEENLLYQNNGQLEFEDVTAEVNLPLTIEPTYGAIWGDYDRDGWLDLYITDKKLGDDFNNVSNHLYKNIDGESFTEVTSLTNTADSSKAPFCGAFMDINNNGWQDIYLAQDRLQINTLLKNMGDGTYSDISASSGTDLPMNAMCVTVGDYNNDLFQDIYVSNTPEGNSLFKNNGDETFDELAAPAGVGFYNTGWSSSFFDYNNDGWLDLYVCNMFGKNFFYKNLDGENFETLENFGFEKDTVTSFANAIGDINNDGFPDIVVNNANEDQSTLWQNPGGDNNWLKIKLTGTYSNKEAVGTRLIAYCNNNTYSRYIHLGIGYLAQDSQYQIIGVNNSSTIDSLEVFWLSGIKETFYDIPANSILEITEGENSVLSPKLNTYGTIEICESDSLILNCGYYSNQFKYHWSNGSESIFNVIKEEGTYFLDIEDIEGNKYRSDSLTVTFSEGPSILNKIVTQPSCFNASDGKIELEISGGITPYDIIWEHGETGSTIENLSYGTYKVNILDQSGCHIAHSFELINPEKLLVDYDTEDDINENATGSIKLTVFGGVPPYYYYWGEDFIEGSSEYTGLRAGKYKVKVNDSFGCSTHLEIEVEASFTTGITDNNIIEPIIFPNPAADFLTIKSDLKKSYKLIITDLLGNVLLKEMIHDNISINLKDYRNGIYLIKLGNNHFQKLIVNH